MDKLPIPSFHYSFLDRIEESPDSSIGLDDEDGTESLQTQYEEGAYEDTAWYCTKAKTRPTVASMNTASVRSQTSEPSTRVGASGLVEASPVHQARDATTQSNEESSHGDETPRLNLKRVTRSSTRLVRIKPSVLTINEEYSSSEVTPPASLADSQVTVVAPPNLLSISRKSASVGADTSSINRKRSKRSYVSVETESSGVSPPLALPDTTNTQAAVVTPSRSGRRGSRSNSIESASVCADTSSSNRKRRKKHDSETPVASKKKKKKNKTKSKLEHTTDFEAKTAEAFGIPAHTLIIGTHPSRPAQKKNEYYGYNMSAFWWIVGDCFGFRRAEAVTKEGNPYKIASELRYDTSHILPYEMQLQTLCCKGFALWNTLHKCLRRGSSDCDIEGDGEPNDIRKFCQERPSIRRIVFSNGKSNFEQFAKRFRDWLESGELVASPHPASQQAFAPYCHANAATPPPDRTIECIVALAVSPAAATYSYSQKRDFWEEHVFRPGLEDFEEWHSSAIARGR